MSSWPGRWSQMGQTEKNSLRANIFRVTPESGHCSMQSACLKGANIGSRQLHSITSIGGVRENETGEFYPCSRESARAHWAPKKFHELCDFVVRWGLWD